LSVGHHLAWEGVDEVEEEEEEEHAEDGTYAKAVNPVGLNMPTDVELGCMSHHLIDVVDPPVVIVIVVINDVVISYNTILYS
jgi:hypothetical protein